MPPPHPNDHALLIACAAPAHELADAINQLRQTYTHVTILIRPEHQLSPLPADEIWLFDRLGLRGFLALIRRISWRQFAAIYDFWPPRFSWLRYFIWPCPPWYHHYTAPNNTK